jgi:hypothetical protein
MAPKPKYTQPASADFQKEVASKDYTPPGVVTGGTEPGLSENGYVGVDPIYQNHANHTEAPYEAEDSAESKLHAKELSDDVDFSLTDPPEGEGDVVDTDETTTAPGASGSTSSGPSTPAPPAGGSNS